MRRELFKSKVRGFGSRTEEVYIFCCIVRSICCCFVNPRSSLNGLQGMTKHTLENANNENILRLFLYVVFT